MQVFRFMSLKELKKYLKGNTLVNTTVHKESMNRSKTDSKGFCFFNIEDFDPEEAVHILAGIVNLEVCCVFEVEEKELTKSWGLYAKHPDFTKMTKQEFNNRLLAMLCGDFSNSEDFKQTEYCTTTYNNKSFKLIKLCILPSIIDIFKDKEWSWIDNEKLIKESI